jgi:hypothetical protein
MSHVAIYKWIKKYVGLMQICLEQIKSSISDAWRADELYVKVKGNPKYLFALMDDQTQFWIAQQVAHKLDYAIAFPIGDASASDQSHHSHVQPVLRLSFLKMLRGYYSQCLLLHLQFFAWRDD